jgi:hypothetical protein
METGPQGGKFYYMGFREFNTQARAKLKGFLASKNYPIGGQTDEESLDMLIYYFCNPISDNFQSLSFANGTALVGYFRKILRNDPLQGYVITGTFFVRLTPKKKELTKK